MNVRHAVRLLARAPLFTLTSIVSLAVGIAASTTILGIGDAMLLRTSAAIRDGGQVVDIARTRAGSGFGPMSYPVFRHLSDHTRTLEGMAATTVEPVAVNMHENGLGERVYARTVSGTFFDVLRVRPALGRFFRPDEDVTPGLRPVAVLSHRFWRERFGADPRILERTLRLNRTDFAVIGVAEADFDGATLVGTDLWVPIAMAGMSPARTPEFLRNPAALWLGAVGRLRPGVGQEAAQAELDALLEAYKAVTPAVDPSHRIAVMSGGRLPLGLRGPFATFTALLFVMACGLLAIACASVTGMQLARASIRRREMATRAAIGASRQQLIAQLLIETLILFVAAFAVSIPVAMWLTRAIPLVLPPLPIPIEVASAISMRAWVVAGAIAAVAAMLSGLAPARHALKTDVAQELHGHGSTTALDRLRLRHALVVAQVAISLAVAIAAGLFVRTLQAAANVDLGYDIANVQVVSLDTAIAGAQGPRAVELMTRVVDRVREVPGVVAVAHARQIPLLAGGFAIGRVRVPGVSDAVAQSLIGIDWETVSSDYFRTLGVPVAEGRAFTPEDRDGRPLVAIVNETFARLVWPSGGASGQRIWQGDRESSGRQLLVVGVVRDTRYRNIGEAPRPMVYVPFAQQPQARVELFVRHGSGTSVSTAVRAAIGSVDPQLPIVLMQSLETAAGIALLPQRFAAAIAGAVGAVGTLLAALGLYGLAAFLVAQRTREIAIRMALGASPRDVRSIVLGQTARLGAIGAAAGVALAWGLGTAIQRLRLLIGVQPADPVTYIGLLLLMSAVLFAAVWLPARRAMSTDPASALRAN